ncbi:acetyltransferase (GNAT) family domain-containing protein [Ditylenchus destructor]|uniref:aralkylamine N-acetyltransferase n=1 Tax=Ditylenchus destructor TaxID=166010 RepID=A0AAD4MP92_9BILA|nr:acetyltransferase (GNAT) family domain-containing protein [Ditylenchus destructor]
MSTPSTMPLSQCHNQPNIHSKDLNTHQVIEDFSIVKAHPSDSPDILKFMLKDFLKTESLNAALGLTAEEATEFFGDIIKCCFEDEAHNCNYLVRSKETNKIVGLRLACILDRERGEESQAFSADQKEPPKVKEIKEILHSVESQTWNLVPKECNRLASWMVLSVDKDFGRRGIGQKLIEHNLDELREFGCQGIVTEASAFKSQQLFKKNGYSRPTEILHAHWKDMDGKQIFVCPDGTDRVTMEFKLL